MNILMLLGAIMGVCLADKLPIQSSYSFPPPLSNPSVIRSRPATQSSYSTPISTSSVSRPTFAIAPQRSHSLPKATPTATNFFTVPQNTYSSHQSIFVTPKPTYSAPQHTYSAPQHTYSAPQPTYSAPHTSYAKKPVVQILRDDRVHPKGGAYSFWLETADGVKRQESASPVYTKDGPVASITGSYSFTLPDGQLFELHYIADENGFQPQSSFIPVGPAFPHPIPAHALEQIERGRREHEARARGELLRQHSSQSYTAPSGPSGYSRHFQPSTTYGVPR